MREQRQLPVALTIAGSDSGGGAGIQADLKTFAAFGVHGTSAITAITAQNTITVTDIHEVPVRVIRAQIDAVIHDMGVQAAKTGMLASAEIIEAVSNAIREHGIEKLVVTPNLPEAEVLLGRSLRTLDDRRQAARDLVALGPHVAVVKGGHADSG